MLASSPDQRRFFGLDISQWPSQWSAAGDLLLRSRALQWLAPVVRVQLTQANGQTSAWDMVQGVAAYPVEGQSARGDQGSELLAIELLPEQVLRRQLVLPQLARADLARAVALEVAAISPFPPERTASAFAARPGPGGDTLSIDVALTSTQEIDKRLEQVSGAAGSTALASSANAEIWVLPGNSTNARETCVPLVFEGYGGAERKRRAARVLGVRIALLALALLLLIAVAVTPTVQATLRAAQAQQAFDQLNIKAKPQLAQREEVVKQTERLQTIAKLAEQQLAPLPVLDMLTKALPDSAWLSNLRQEGAKVTINGIADDAAALVRILGNQPGVAGVRSPSPATRVGNSNKESFSLELTLDPAVYGMLRTGVAP
ncbi:PilN domain-containing protein [Ottowia thiooxydans]|uniref:PilN domain-containing protein n=1 Tax=Ottowia thiooxydans TaxID=219182 RepID=UPI0004217C22|nr:PilN domain-containing protein [Ottowia thiooxydans]